MAPVFYVVKISKLFRLDHSIAAKKYPSAESRWERIASTVDEQKDMDEWIEQHLSADCSALWIVFSLKVLNLIVLHLSDSAGYTIFFALNLLFDHFLAPLLMLGFEYIIP